MKSGAKYVKWLLSLDYHHDLIPVGAEHKIIFVAISTNIGVWKTYNSPDITGDERSADGSIKIEASLSATALASDVCNAATKPGELNIPEMQKAADVADISELFFPRQC